MPIQAPAGTERQNRCKPAPIRNSTSSNHWRRPNGIHHSRNERHCRHHAAHVAARFPSLGNYDINAAVHGSLCVICRTNRVQHEGPTCLGAWNKGRRVTPEEGDDGDSFIEADREPLFLKKFQDQIDGEWPWGQGARFPYLPPHLVTPLIWRPNEQSPALGVLVAQLKRRSRAPPAADGSRV